MTDISPIVDRVYHGHCWLKTPDGPRRISEPLTDAKIRQHIEGVKAFGACPITPGTSTTRIALLDLDSHKGETSWPEMLSIANSLQAELLNRGMYGWQWRSSGGSGVHIFILWEEPQDAYSVRESLKSVLSDCLLVSGTGGVAKGEVEIFPKQNELPLDGYGSMFILPLAGKSETLGDDEPVMSTPVPVLTKPVRVNGTDVLHHTPADLKRLESALNAIPNSGDHELGYDQWRNICFGIYQETQGSGHGHALAHAFSARASKYDPDFLDNRVWNYIRHNREGGITGRTIFAIARDEYGWREDVAGDFEPVQPPEKPGVKTPRFAVKTKEEFIAGKPPGWIVDDVLPHATVGMVYGEPSSGKSFFTLDLVGSIARGAEWFGHKVEPGAVVYLAAEGAGGFRNRVKVYMAAHPEPFDLGVIDDAPDLTKLEDVRDLVTSIKAFGNASVIVVDTLAQTTPGANENTGEDMGKALGHCRTLHKATGAMVLLVHHSGKDATKGARGWSGIQAAMDVEIEVTRNGDDRAATITKMKDGDDRRAYGFRLTVVPVEQRADGKMITSCLLEAASEPLRQLKREPKGSVERLVLRTVLDNLEGDGLADLGLVVDEAINQLPFDHQTGKKDRRREAVLRALDSLRDTGRVSIAGVKIGIVQ